MKSRTSRLRRWAKWCDDTSADLAALIVAITKGLATLIAAISKGGLVVYTALGALYLTLRLIGAGASRWVADLIGLVW